VRHRWSDTFRSAPGYTRLFALGWGLRDRKDSYEFATAADRLAALRLLARADEVIE